MNYKRERKKTHMLAQNNELSKYKSTIQGWDKKMEYQKLPNLKSLLKTST